MSPAKRPPKGKGRPTPPADVRPVGSTRWTRWIAYALIALFGVYWLFTAFARHTIGNYGVETDFYWKYGPAARDLLHGIIKIENYDSKGFGYPMVVALVSLLGFDFFRAGQMVGILSAVGSAWMLYRLHRSLFGPTHALASLAIVLANLTFIQNTYEVGTDMFFVFVSLVSVGLLLRSKTPTLRTIALSGLIGGFAFSTRYNALFLLPGAFLLFFFFRVPGGSLRDHMRQAAVWCGAYLLGALPWLIVNAIYTGNPLTNTNYMNVAFSVYGEGNWEKFFYGTRSIHTLPDVIRLDPAKFAGTMVRNIFNHVGRDLSELLPLAMGALAAAGAFLLWKDRAERRAVGYFAFGALCFFTLVPVFYGVRFSLPLLPFYAALAAWPLVSPTLGKPLEDIERSFPLRSFIFLLVLIPVAVAAYARTEDPTWIESVAAGPHDIEPAIHFLRGVPHSPDVGLVARKPHAAFLAGYRFVLMPEIANLDSLHAVALRERAPFILISSAEVTYRAAIQPLADATGPVPGFRRVNESYGALVFQVVPFETPKVAVPGGAVGP
jgi:Dolichyl-phosphate-mannose-protein mannosyltransferase